MLVRLQTQPRALPPSSFRRRCSHCLDSATSSFDQQDPGCTKVLDVRVAFSPQSAGAIAWKVAAGAATMATLFHELDNSVHKVFFFAYLTNWTLILSVLFHLLSCLNSLVPVVQPRSNILSMRVKLTWMLFAVAAHSQLLVTLLFWGVLYPQGDVDKITAGMVLAHGGLLALVLLEGLVVNRIPVCPQHYFMHVIPFDVLYVAWTVLHAVLRIGNPDRRDDDPAFNDDAIYSVIDWRGDTRQTGLFVGFLVGVLSPFLYVLLWFLSLCTQRYIFLQPPLCSY